MEVGPASSSWDDFSGPADYKSRESAEYIR